MPCNSPYSKLNTGLGYDAKMSRRPNNEERTTEKNRVDRERMSYFREDIETSRQQKFVYHRIVGNLSILSR